VGATVTGHERAQSGSEERPGHVGEGEEQEGAAAEGVDGPEGREGEEEVDGAEAEGREERIEVRGPGLLEDGAAVESDDVDTAELERRCRCQNTCQLQDSAELSGMPLLTCCPIMTTKAARVALLRRGT
jgi:hypothetical protein